MKRHELWNDRAEKLMEKTFEKFGFGKKDNTAKEEKKEEIKESLQEAPQYGEDYADMDVNEEEYAGPSDVKRLAMRIDVLKKRIENKDGITGEDVVEELELISSMLQSSDEIKEEETENPEVERAEDAARKAKIKALQLQLKDLQSK